MAADELAGKLSRRLQVDEQHNGEAEQQEPPAATATATEPPLDSGAGGELSAKLQRRCELNEGGGGDPAQLSPGRRVFSPYTEFREFSRRQIKDMEQLFRQLWFANSDRH
uniref:Uncharacterized protein n=1 Tax=Sphaerodactylus townsendi TaxID=933632 RepID=A0ACB8EEF4_9SAUR